MHTTSMFVKLCECIKHTEDPEETGGKGTKSCNIAKQQNTNSKSNAKSTKRGSKKRSAAGKEQMFCELHQTYGHDTSECKVVLAQAKKMHVMWEANVATEKTMSYDKGNSHKSHYSKKELHELISKGIKCQLKKSQSGKKCKENNSIKTDSINAEFNLSDSNDKMDK